MKRTQTVDDTSLVHPSNHHQILIALLAPHRNEQIENQRRIKIAFCESRELDRKNKTSVRVFKNEKIVIYYWCDITDSITLSLLFLLFFSSQLVYFLFMDVVFVYCLPLVQL